VLHCSLTNLNNADIKVHHSSNSYSQSMCYSRSWWTFTRYWNSTAACGYV